MDYLQSISRYLPPLFVKKLRDLTAQEAKALAFIEEHKRRTGRYPRGRCVMVETGVTGGKRINMLFSLARSRARQSPKQNRFPRPEPAQLSFTDKLKKRVSLYKSRTKEEGFGVNEVLEKIGSSPRCHYTGQPINLRDTESWDFDHIYPVAKGGRSTLDNLAITYKSINRAKGSLTPTEFVELCRLVVDHHAR